MDSLGLSGIAEMKVIVTFPDGESHERVYDVMDVTAYDSAQENGSFEVIERNSGKRYVFIQVEDQRNSKESN